VAAYDRMLQAGSVSEALYFNRGNALFKMGQLGRAIASYRQAEQLAPRDADLRANLQFARTQALGGTPYRTSYWHRWLTTLTLNEWTLLTAGMLWVVFLLLALVQWQPELKGTLRNWILVTSMVLVFLGICLAATVNEHYFAQSAIVVAGEAEIRNGPLDESQTVYKVRDGVELTILDHKDGWYQVVDQALRQEQVLPFEFGAAQGKRG
jgi:tetratricopeptide (TPR) repeat protein